MFFMIWELLKENKQLRKDMEVLREQRDNFDEWWNHMAEKYRFALIENAKRNTVIADLETELEKRKKVHLCGIVVRGNHPYFSLLHNSNDIHNSKNNGSCGNCKKSSKGRG